MKTPKTVASSKMPTVALQALPTGEPNISKGNVQPLVGIYSSYLFNTY